MHFPCTRFLGYALPQFGEYPKSQGLPSLFPVKRVIWGYPLGSSHSVISDLVFLSLNRSLMSSHSQWSLAHRQVPKVMGHGFNTFGLPGDPSPPSRFVKMFFERQIALTNSPPKKKVEDGREPWKVVSYPIVGAPQKDAEMWETWKYVYT